MTSRAIAGIVFFAAGPALAQTPASVTVPMLDVGGRPVIEAKINGAGPYRLIFDTGASNTVLDPSLVGGTTGPVTLKSLDIGEMRFDNVGVRSGVIMPGLPDDFPKGVLSGAQFPGYLVTYDFPAKTITIARGALPPADNQRVFQYGADEVLPVAPITVAGHQFLIHVDTGSPGGVMLPVRYAKELPLDGELVKVGAARTPAGTFDVFTAKVNGTIAVGAFPLPNVSLRFSDVSPGNGPGPGNMGGELLKTFKLTFDSKNRRLRFEQ